MRNTLLLFILLWSIQTVTFARKRDFYYYQARINALMIRIHEKSSSVRYPIDDPDDRVDIDRWNELNEEAIQRVPQITDYSDDHNAVRWLEWFVPIAERYQQVSIALIWNYETNITKATQQTKTAQSLKQSVFTRLAFSMAKEFNEFMKDSRSDDLKRIFGRLASSSISHNDDDVKRASTLSARMMSIYSTEEVCEIDDSEKCYSLSPYLERLMQVEKDYDRLAWAWKGWYDQVGNKIRPLYLEYVDVLTKTSQENGYQDIAEYWISDYEMGNATQFEHITDQILEDIKPLYEQLHAYVRGRLCKIYPGRFDCRGPIPAHILGNMWAQTWHDRYDDLEPYPEAPLINITQLLKEKRYTIHRMYRTAEEFFTSIGLYPMTPKFWTRSLFEKPEDREVVCQPAAYDLSYHDDYRVRICTVLNDDYFYTVHHEMGHVEYYMSYAKTQPYFYRGGANSAFHEAIGDTIGIYAISPTHLIKLGFLDREALTPEYEINFLMRLALQKVAFMPFAYAMDKYRFALFRDEINREHELNSMWWALRIEHGGVMAAVHRSDATNFDPGAKYHIPANTPYFRYFVADILQFQFYRAMCRLKGHTGSLHLCDIYGREDVGERFKEMLEMGNSKPWSEILESLTDERELKPDAMLQYFQPLYTWLKKENLARGYPVGWM